MPVEPPPRIARPAVPGGPIISLVYRVTPERRADVLALLRDAFPLYERPGGIRMGLYESMDEPGLWLELVAYAGEAEYAADQNRVESDPEMRATLEAWKALLSGPVEVRKLRPLELAAAAAEAEGPRARVDAASFNDHGAIALLLEGARLPVPGADDAPVHMLVVRDDAGVAGCIGYERHGALGLLRSLAVRAEVQRRGVGRALVRAVCERLSGEGADCVFLLTTAASRYFEQLGFVEATSSEVPNELRASRELSLPCCETAVLMQRRLRIPR